MTTKRERLLADGANGKITYEQLLADVDPSDQRLEDFPDEHGQREEVYCAALEAVVAEGIAAIERGDSSLIQGREGTKALLERLNARRNQRLAASIDEAASDLAKHGPVSKTELGNMLIELEKEWQEPPPKSLNRVCRIRPLN